MRYLVLASDYDGTLATDGQIDPLTVEALERLLASGRKLVMVTGRELDELIEVCPRLDLFEWVVAENGALLYHPATKSEKLLGERPPERFIQMLADRGVQRVSVGRVIVATWHPYENAVLESIRDLGLELQVIFNKGAVMILPSGVNKATGLSAALQELGISAHNVVGAGDAENDHAFLSVCECSVAVSNALPMLKERSDIVTALDHGRGVTELIEQIIADDLADYDGRLERHAIVLGNRDGAPYTMHPYRTNVLIAGSSGSGKSTLAVGIIERLLDQGYQCCVIDPEGDYETFEHTVALGSRQQTPVIDEVLSVLENPASSAVVNMMGVPLADRPTFFLSLLARLQDLRARRGHPHWTIVDEAQHVLPAEFQPGAQSLPQKFDRMLFITLDPKSIEASALKSVDLAAAVGDEPQEILRSIAEITGEAAPARGDVELASGEVLLWPRTAGEAPFKMTVIPGRTVHRRHVRKYAAGELLPEESFYFRGPDGKFNLRAQNLILFLQLGEGVDDATWLFHLKRGDYSNWFRDAIKDDVLADEARALESAPSAEVSRQQIRELIERYYILAAKAAAVGDAHHSIPPAT